MDFLHHQFPLLHPGEAYPEGLYLGLAPYSPSGTLEAGPGDAKPADVITSSDDAVYKLSAAFLPGGGGLQITRDYKGKPCGQVDYQPVGISISHTRNRILAGISSAGEVGVDLESVYRSVHPALARRLSCPRDAGCNELEPIRLWTIKEAALKWHGTGLRFPMRNVGVDRESDHFFRISIGNKSAQLISFRYSDHWIAAGFDQPGV